MRTLFGDHSYARTAIGNDASLEPITHEDLDAWFKTNQRPLVPLIIIDGIPTARLSWHQSLTH